MNIAEAFNSGTALESGKLIRAERTSPDDPLIVSSQLIDVPEGKTEEQFVDGLLASADSYDGETNYPVLGISCAGRLPCANSNSFIGNILRQTGVAVEPAETAPLWTRDALPGDRKEPAPPLVKDLVRNLLNQAERMIKRAY